MLPTFVIGLREGLEASLIVSIVATFLFQRGRRDLLRWVFVGVGIAIVLCGAVGIVLQIVSQNLPQRQQEGLETVIGLVAVAMVTYMVVWMRRHSRNLKGQLEGAAADALAAGSGLALVLMAFLAVMREGFETAVFLLAAFNESASGASAWLGAILGIVVAVGLGYAIFRGGVKLNLSRFFRFTGVVLVLVAAGLVVNAVHTAHEAGWLNVGQDQFADLTAVVRPGSVQSSLLTGMLGIQERPTVIEFVAWLVYLVPIGLYVAWPPGRGLKLQAQRRLYATISAVGVVAGVLLLTLAPSAATGGASTFGGQSIQVDRLSADDGTATVGDQQLSLTRSGSERIGALATDVYTATSTDDAATGPTTMTLGAVAKANGGRLPLGAAPSGTDFATTVPVSYRTTTTATLAIEPSTRQVVSYQTSKQVVTTARLATGATPVGDSSPTVMAAAPSDVATATATAQHGLDTRTRHQSLVTVGIAAIVIALATAGLWLFTRPRRSTAAASETHPISELAIK